MSETAKPEDTKSAETIGNVIVGSGLIVMGLAVVVGTLFGVAFIAEIAAIALFITGIMMMRGLFGANATVGAWMAILGPAAIVVPPFFPMLWWIAPFAGVFFTVAGITKLPGIW